MSKIQKTEENSGDVVENESTEPESATNFSKLHPEMLAAIFNYLKKEDRVSSALVCINWRDACYQPAAGWRRDTFVWKSTLNLSTNPTLTPSLVRRGIRRVTLSLTDPVDEPPFAKLADAIPKIRALRIFGKQVNDAVLSHPDLLTGLAHVTELNLTMCEDVTDVGVEKIVGSLSKLVRLDLGGCRKITDMSLYHVGRGLKNLKSLHLKFDSLITDAGIGNLCDGDNPPKLEELDLLACSQLTDLALRYLARDQRSIRILTLVFCHRITGVGLRYLARITELRELCMSCSQHIDKQGIWYLSQTLVNLRSLSLERTCSITDDAIETIRKLTSLRDLYLDGCSGISDVSLTHLAAMTGLQKLSISYCPITNAGLANLAEGGSKVTCLEITFCSAITDDGFHHIGMLSSLQNLSVVHCVNVEGRGFCHLPVGMVDLDVTSFRQYSLQDLNSLLRITELRMVTLNPLQVNDDTVVRLLFRGLPRLQYIRGGKGRLVTRRSALGQLELF